MYQSLSEFFADAKSSGKDWIKSQVKLSAITFVLLLVGLFVADIICEKKFNDGVAWDVLIPFIALAIAIIDAVPVLGISITMLPWAALATIFSEEKKVGLAILIVYLVIMLIKQIIEPFIRGKSLGVSPVEELVCAVIGYIVFPGTLGSALGLIIVPVVYTAAKKIYIKNNPSFAEKKNAKLADKGDVIDITNDVKDVKDE
ncbi:MAG: AI-2E family transporter [Clostridia bacterium]|nr:AI-2E family transporter [Candidatus Limimonas egerieequi]MCQ2489827.1 AI-2E family transporter [Clostridia bacterium]